MQFSLSLCMLMSAALATAQTATTPLPALPTGAKNCTAARLAVPSCGLPCLASAATAVGCGTTNATCICAQTSAVEANAEDCVISACGMATALLFSNASHAVCANCA
ncbi:hypothetical protein V8E51_016793 [Hyaloscypha variabilis]|uniref:CFEM domain-containing protein n=1 Tax=Hyaloscypha variabilis (strain UAMH 11265 / GT02V1 / F) TaxID=1149755 RepID=A0A2J6RJ42_HYAVF|nr:hypothetical protein L207DRAFT_531402 [Hyaloscypha variabilis F]